MTPKKEKDFVVKKAGQKRLPVTRKGRVRKNSKMTGKLNGV